MWWVVVENWLTARLLSSPIFHHAVRRVHKRVHEIRHGRDPADMGGTKIDHPEGSGTQKFLNYYVEELRNQFRGSVKK